MKLNKIFYINLYNRKDRLFFCENQLKNLNIDYQRFDAVQHKNGRIGCAKSHLKVLQYIVDIQYDGYYLILEDDFFFSTNIDFSKFIHKMKQSNASVFCLSYTYEKSKKIDDSFIQILKCFSTCAYIIHSSFAPTLIKNFEEAILIKKAIDVHWNELQKKYTFIAFKKPLVLQLPSFSNITNQDTLYQNHSYIFLEPNEKSFGDFLFEFLLCLDLCIRFKKFLFIKNWDLYNPYFTMSFFPHKKLSRKNENILTSICPSTILSENKNYLLKQGFSYEISSIPFKNISDFLNFPNHIFPLINKLSVGILFLYQSSSEYNNLIYRNYFIDIYHQLSKKYNNSTIDIFTDNITKCTKYWKPFKNIRVYQKNSFETLHSLSKYEILVLGNNSLSWWSAYLNQNPNKQLYFPKEWFKIRKPNPYPVFQNEISTSLHPITYIIFDFYNQTIPPFILNNSYPIIIYTTRIKNYSHNQFNIQIHQIEKKNCISKSIFSNLHHILESEKINLLYKTMKENPFQTKYFGFLPISYFPYLYFHSKKLHPRKINILSVSNSSLGLIGTKLSIEKIHKEYYTHLFQHKKNIHNYFLIFSKYQKLTGKNNDFILYICFVLIIIILLYFIL